MLYEVEKLTIQASAIDDETEKYEASIDYCLNYISGDNRGGKYQNIEMAKADFDIEYFIKRIHQLKQECQQVKLARRQQHEEAVNEKVTELPEMFEKTQNLTGCSKEEIEEKREEWIKKKTVLIKENCQERLTKDDEDVADYYQSVIKECEAEISKAEKRYEESTPNNAVKNGKLLRELDAVEGN